MDRCLLYILYQPTVSAFCALQHHDSSATQFGYPHLSSSWSRLGRIVKSQCCVALAIVLDAIREYFAHVKGPNSIWVKIFPIPSMLGIPPLIGGYFTLDMTIGAVILGLWQYFAYEDSLISAPLVASALIAGDGVWSVPSAILALAKVSPPLCAQACPLDTVSSAPEFTLPRKFVSTRSSFWSLKA